MEIYGPARATETGETIETGETTEVEGEDERTIEEEVEPDSTEVKEEVKEEEGQPAKATNQMD